MPDALFVADHDRFVPTELARGPWDPNALHGGPVAALVAGGWLLSGRLPVAGPGPDVSLEGGSAKVPKELRHKADAPRPGRESR